MAVIKNYNREYHDLFLYDRLPSVQPKIDAKPIAYNPKCEAIKAGVDFTGCAARDQRFNNRASFSGNQQYDDINFWNNGYFAAVLITPRHALVCHHYHGETQTHPQIPNLRWLGKDGKFYQRTAIKNKRLWLHDLRLVEFSEEFPIDQVKIYNRIADTRYIPINYSLWTQDAQNRIYRMKLEKTNTNNNQLNGTQTTWWPKVFTDDGFGYNEGFFRYDPTIPVRPNVFPGDSGSPTFVLTESGETILVGLAWGGSIITPSIMELIKYEIDNQYPLEYVKVAARSGDINQDGKVDGQDMTLLMSKWGSNDKLYDLDKDGTVGSSDLAILQSQWGEYGMTHSVEIIPPTQWDPPINPDPIPFPKNPTIGQQFSYSGMTWTWNGNAWQTIKVK